MCTRRAFPVYSFIALRLCSPYCMHEFEVSLHHNITVLHKKRLVVLMKFPNPLALCRSHRVEEDAGAGSSLVTDSLRQYLRQYTYIDLTSKDWINKLFYALPVKGMITKSVSSSMCESTTLL